MIIARRWTALLLFLPIFSFAQISGTVYGLENDRKSPLTGANVFWKGTEAGTVTDQAGNYTIAPHPESNTLVVSFIGFHALEKNIISQRGIVNFELKASGNELSDVEVVGEVDATTVDLRKAELTYLIDDKEMRKAACCNLSESFETNASVDVSFTDAVTGQRQIEMLGLAGKYAFIQRENIPFARGLNANTGLTFIPGPFVESLQLTKGLSSVVNGFESITGQINIELYKPETAPAFMGNAYVNQGARSELNLILNRREENNSFTGLLAHGSLVPFAQDNNGDGFADMPLRSQINLLPRWHWRSESWEGQLGVSYINDQARGGEMDFLSGKSDSLDPAWGYEADNRRIEAYGKSGYFFPGSKDRSLGLIYSFSSHTQNATFGQRSYQGQQNSAYFNSIFQSQLKSPSQRIKAGLSVQVDWVNEDYYLAEREVIYYQIDRNEIIPGGFFEYSFEPSPRFTLVSGLRLDYTTYFREFFFTPRMHLRYQPVENTTFRLGGGSGRRTPNIIAEQLSLLASSRELNFDWSDTLLPEKAWNVGASISQVIPLGNRDLKLNIDGFYTWFASKLVSDLADPLRADLIFSRGSRSFSLLSQIDMEITKRFEARLAYKYLDSREQMLDRQIQSYFIPAHRAFLNLAYVTESKWRYDLTLNWFGTKPLPETDDSPVQFQQPERSQAFFTLNMQINKEFKSGWEIYAGVENLLNYRQSNPIVSAAEPFEDYFDTNFVWGPVFGRNIYLGVNYRLPQGNG